MMTPDLIPQNLVQRAKTLLVHPASEWRVIDAEPATVAGIYKGWVLPLAAIGPIAGFIGSVLFSFSIFRFGVAGVFVTALSSAIMAYVLSIVSVLILSLVIDGLAPNFGAVKNRVQATKVAAYSMTAAWVAGILLILPLLWPLVALAGLYGYYLLFVGLPILMRPPQQQAVTYAIVTIVAAVVLMVIIRAVIGFVSLASLFY